MSFLSPLFFLGLGAIVVPILVHLIQRERKRVIEFPSLMFIQKIPYQSVRRRRIRHWFLLLMRAAAIALLVAAFARPFMPGRLVGACRRRRQPRAGDPPRQLREHGLRRSLAARAWTPRGGAVDSMTTGDRATLVLFGRNAEENIRATSDRGRLEAAIGAATRHVRRHPLRPCAEAGREHPVAVDASPPRSHPHLRFPEVRLDRRRGHPVRRQHHAHAGLGRRGRHEQHLDPVADLQPRRVLRPGAHHRHGRRDEPQCGGGAEGAGEPGDRRARRSRRSTPASARTRPASIAFAPFTLAEPTVRGTIKAGIGPARRRQHVQFRAVAQ